MPLRNPPEPDRLPGDWHKLYADLYEAAVAESAGTLAGGTDTFHKAFRDAVAVAFCWGYTAGRESLTEGTETRG